MSDVFQQRVNRREDHQADRCACDFVRNRLHDRVVDQESDREKDQHDHQPQPRVRARRRRVLEDDLAVVVDQHREQNAGDPRPRRAPSKPEEGSRQQLRVHDFLRRPIQFRLEGTVDPVEEVEMTDPDDSHHNMRPAEDELKPVVYLRIHCALLTRLEHRLQPVNPAKAGAPLLQVLR